MSKKIPVSSPTKTTVFLKGLIISIIISSVCIVAFSAVLLLLGLPKSAASPLSSVAYGIGALFGSYYASKKIGEKGYLCGAIIAILLLIVNIIVGIILNGSQFSAIILIRSVITLIMAVLGGIFGINSNSSKSLVK